MQQAWNIFVIGVIVEKPNAKGRQANWANTNPKVIKIIAADFHD